MNVKIDWLSFTLPIGMHIGWQAEHIADAVGEIMRVSDSPVLPLLFNDHNFTLEKGRPPYSFRWQRDDGGLAVFMGQKMDTALFEIGGKGCDLLAAADELEPLLLLVKDRLTRIDIAADFNCAVTPLDFATSRSTKRHKTTSEFNSPTGSTYYIGSRSSELYARVYRYNKPHPRHALLRVEHVLKRKQARLTAELILTEGLEEVCGMVGARFGWEHPLWSDAEFCSEPLPSVEREHGMKSTVFWLHAQVIPALKRVTEDGTLDLTEWITDFLLPEVYPNRIFTIISKSVL